MEIITSIDDCRETIQRARREGRVGLVPTMGALHAGHFSLVSAARESCTQVMVTIFVNPSQFGPGEDFEAYPRRLQADAAACEKAGVAWIFSPDAGSMYSPDASTNVIVNRLSERLCGASRPGHFAGVATVVSKLFHIAPADAAFFGEKDFQQLQIIRRMVRDLNMPIDIIGCPIARHDDGLALSSRNSYLTPQQREAATCLSSSLFQAREEVGNGTCKRAEDITARVRTSIERAEGARIDYVELVDEQSLEPIVGEIAGRARLCVAVYFGSCRLIDNVAVDPTGSVG